MNYYFSQNGRKQRSKYQILGHRTGLRTKAKVFEHAVVVSNSANGLDGSARPPVGGSKMNP